MSRIFASRLVLASYTNLSTNYLTLTIPLGSDFDSGMEYAVSVNSESEMTFTAQ